MPSDAQLTRGQRAAAIERAGENLALRSGAGCGKTFVLARRYVELLRGADEPETAMRRLVALTFTNKAAAEMSARVRRMLAEAAADAGREEKRRLRAWLDELPEARIATIHGFCRALLRSRAVEAGIDPDFDVCADELLVERLQSEAAEEAVLAAVETGREDAARLLAADPFDQVIGWTRELLNERTTWRLKDYAEPDAILQRWQDMISANRGDWLASLAGDRELLAELKQLREAECSDGGDRLAAVREAQLATIDAILRDPASASAGDFASVTDTTGNIGSKKAWLADVRDVRALVKSIGRRVKAYAVFAEELNAADREAAEDVVALTRLADEARRLYDAEKRRRGLLDFTDLLDAAERLLAGDPDVRRALGRQIQQLLIDECQDTDDFQVRLLGRLIGLAESGPPGPGRLFVVGDAKQSIYRFRGAQVEVFRELCERLGEGNQEALDTSFRTHAAGVAFVNAVFEPLMGKDYERIEAFRGEEPPGASVELLLAGHAGGEPIQAAPEASAVQAAVTAQRIEEMVRGRERLVRDRDAGTWRPVRYGDAAILFARMTNSLDYERELQLRGVPYQVVAGTGLFQQQEVFDVLNALEAVDNPRNDVALMGTLRSSLFGLDDNVLMHVAEAARPPYFDALADGCPGLGDRLAPADREALASAVDLVAELHRIKDALPIDRLLDRLLGATGYEGGLLAGFQGRRRVSNIRKLAEMARAAAGDDVALADYLAEARRLIFDQARQEQAAAAGGDEDFVQIMTIHKAKGLEFPVVVVPDLNAGRRGPAGRLLRRADWGWTFRADAEDDGTEGDRDAVEATSFRIAAALEDRDARAEDIRRLYVAATRHEDHLILVGADWRSSDGRPRSSDSYLAQLDDVLEFDAALGDADDAGVSYGDGRYSLIVRRVRPAEPNREGAPPPGRDLLDTAADAAHLADAVERLAPGPTRLPLAGPLPPERGRVELGVTALCDFRKCPMLYRWRHELRVPRPTGGAPATPQPAASPEPLDAATTGTLFHRCMELLDFAAPQSPAALVRQAAAEMDVVDADLDALAAELADMLDRFRGHPLWADLSAAEATFRELDFVADCGPVTLRGQIDLLARDATGRWLVVDYKSDRVAGAELAARAEGYRLQVQLYAAAAGRHLGVEPAEGCLYFLRPAETASFDVDAGALSAADDEAAALATDLVRRRRENNWSRDEGTHCDGCPYRELCTSTLRRDGRP